MAERSTIELFIFVQKTYQDYGLLLPKSNRNHSPINWKFLLMLFCLAQFFITSAAYAAFEASSMIEYAMAFYTCVTVSASTVIYMELFWQMKDVLNYVENCKRFIESSEYTILTFIH